MSQFKSRVQSTNWDILFGNSCTGTTAKMDKFSLVVNSLHDDCFPEKLIKTSPREQSKPWITKAFKNQYLLRMLCI